MTYFCSNEALTLEFLKNLKSTIFKLVYCILCFLQEPLFYELTVHKLNWTCSFKFSAFETRRFHKTIHPWKPDVFHENHVLELECSNFDAYGWFIPIAQIHNRVPSNSVDCRTVTSLIFLIWTFSNRNHFRWGTRRESPLDYQEAEKPLKPTMAWKSWISLRHDLHSKTYAQSITNGNTSRSRIPLLFGSFLRTV